MSVDTHLVDHRFLRFVPSLILLDQKRSPLFTATRLVVRSVRSSIDVRPQKELRASSLDLFKLTVAASRTQSRDRGRRVFPANVRLQTSALREPV
jgi:hypothetical protein